MPTKSEQLEKIEALMREVMDPELGSDIVTLGMYKGARISDKGEATVKVALTTKGCPLRAQIQNDIKARLQNMDAISSVELEFSELTQKEKSETMNTARANIASRSTQTEIPENTRVFLIASGKGGVGKSTVTVNLAAALAAEGFTVGLMDADIWGFSVPRMLGLDARLEGSLEDKKILPHELKMGKGKLKVVSMGLLIDNKDTALMWRGLILNRAVRHFFEDVLWGDMDYLFVDMPPGTGDVQMGIAKLLPRSEMIVVTTPAMTDSQVAGRAIVMGRKNYLRIAGVIENKTAFITPEGDSYEIYGKGGGQKLATEAGVQLLGQIPIEAAVTQGSDAGKPVALSKGPAAEAFVSLAKNISTQIAPPLDMAGCSARDPQNIAVSIGTTQR